MHLRIGDNSWGNVGVGALRDSPVVRPRPGVAGDGGDDAGDGRGDASAGVVVRLSPEARKHLDQERTGDDERPDETVVGGKGDAGKSVTGKPDAEKPDGEKPDADKAEGKKDPGHKLNADEQRVVHKLEARDTQVRAHEAAHMAAAKGLGGAASYTFETGPDGQRYAVGGEVPVQISSGRTPQETIQNAQTVRAAALAPADPSAQDMAVAAEASQMEAQARTQQAEQQREGTGEPGGIPGAHHDDKAPALQAPDQKSSGDAGHDSLMVFSAIKAERPAVSGSLGHLHSGPNCGFCKGAAAKYG